MLASCGPADQKNWTRADMEQSKKIHSWLQGSSVVNTEENVLFTPEPSQRIFI